MKCVVLCGGKGSRLGSETDLKPKPMVEIGGKPLLWHLIRIFASQHYGNFLMALGHKGEVIRRYFRDYAILNADFSVSIGGHGAVYYHDNIMSDFNKLSLLDTGENTQTGGRIARLKGILKDDPRFFVTYGDGLANIGLEKLLSFHKSHGRIATVTAVSPPTRFGELALDGTRVTRFREKPSGHVRINGGFMIFERAIFDYLGGDDCVLEEKPMDDLVIDNQLQAYIHDGWWGCVDTQKDLANLNALWDSGKAPWKTWL